MARTPFGEAGMRRHVLDALAAEPDLALLLLQALDVLGVPSALAMMSPRFFTCAPRPAGALRGPTARTTALLLELQILAGRGVGEALDQAGAGLRHARAHAPDESQLEDRRDHHLVGDDLLDLVEQRLALLRGRAPGLALEEIVDLAAATP